jgi:hypothetical protein
MYKLSLFVIITLVMGIITSLQLTTTLVAAQKEMSMEMPHAPKGMKNMTFSPNDARNQTIGMDNSPPFDNRSAGSIDLTINQ